MAMQQDGGDSCDVETSGEANALGQEAHKLILAREYDAARPIVERALALEPHNAMLAHTKAHLCTDSGAFEEGAAYLRSFLNEHDPFQGINVHNAWHLAYMELELGHPQAALDWHRRVVAPTVGAMTFFSAVSLLWRMEVAGNGGPDLRSDWEILRRAALGAAGKSHLDDLGRAMAFIATGDEASLDRLLERLDAASDNPVLAEVLRPLIEGLRAYWRGDFAAATRLIEPLVPSFRRLSEFTDQLTPALDTLEAARTRAFAAAAREATLQRP